jgi:hypothetical protein
MTSARCSVSTIVHCSSSAPIAPLHRWRPVRVLWIRLLESGGSVARTKTGVVLRCAIRLPERITLADVWLTWSRSPVRGSAGRQAMPGPRTPYLTRTEFLVRRAVLASYGSAFQGRSRDRLAMPNFRVPRQPTRIIETAAVRRVTAGLTVLQQSASAIPTTNSALRPLLSDRGFTMQWLHIAVLQWEEATSGPRISRFQSPNPRICISRLAYCHHLTRHSQNQQGLKSPTLLEMLSDPHG